MSLLAQFGIKPLEKKAHRGGKNVCKCYMSVTLGKSPSYMFSIADLLKEEKLDWVGMDIGFSKQHGGVIVCKGNDFKFQERDKHRVRSKDVFELIWKSFAIKPVKTKARILFDYKFLSEDVYVLLLDKIDFNY